MGCLIAFYFSPFEVRDDSNPSGDGLPHLSRIKLGGATTRAPERFGRLACGPHGARRKENPGAEPPSDLIGSLAALMEHAGRRVRAPSPRVIRSARLRPSWSTPEGESDF